MHTYITEPLNRSKINRNKSQFNTNAENVINGDGEILIEVDEYNYTWVKN